jgi:ribosomal protein S18 acetylase RimI-like enzyme
MERNDSSLTIRRIELCGGRAKSEILALQRLSYQQEGQIIGYDRIPALFDTPESLLQSGEMFWGCYTGGELVGLISASGQKEVLEICRLVVHPQFQRQGIATKLLGYLVEIGREYIYLRVSAASKNIPALALYQKNHFKEIARRQTSDGLELVTLQRSLVDNHSRIKGGLH